jgi:hypothetical protein
MHDYAKNIAYVAVINTTFVIFPVGRLEKEMLSVLLELVTKNYATLAYPLNYYSISTFYPRG